ncbi:hypothetical protein [Nocardia iowensis]|uniref:Uncharacterized protein n=1 Tax=Nocardia iowensis TaxID=204891 RepID=A0ABX8REZ8_NOCIO|nr:hypothetical protein [Nocardia iowensis]QXN88178.1 hypothetical protein KV110_21410 [Nocardia iowensis]
MTDLSPQEQRYMQLLDELQQARGIEVYFEERGPVEKIYGDVPTTFARLAELHGLILDPELQQGFLRFEGVSSHWGIYLEDTYLSGEFSVRHLGAAMFATAKHLVTEDSTEFERHLYPQLRVFDSQPRTGVGTMAALRIQPGVTTPEIWYYHGTRGTFRLDLNYREYLDALLVTKGAHGWQYLFADVDMKNDEFHGPATNMRIMLAAFPDLFPDHDYSPLRARLAERLR